VSERSYSEACVHGRFQPPHREHLEYIEEALKRSDHVIVGITQPNSAVLDECEVDPHRALPSENPLTYEERCRCIKAMLLEREYDSSRFSFTPFPIDRPQELKEYVRIETPCLTTIRTTWNIEKIERLRALGYEVQVLWDRREIPGIEGQAIRKMIRDQDPRWTDLVAPAVARLMIDEGLTTRIAAGK